MARHAEHLLHQAVVYDSLAAAVATCHWLVGTSARRREYRHAPLTPRELAHRLPAYMCSIRTSVFSLVQRIRGSRLPSWTSVMTSW